MNLSTKESQLNWSEQQNNVFNEFKHTKKNLVIIATAGSGKTTTTLNLLNFVPKFHRSIFLSFSNQIVDELKLRVPKNIHASTLHSLGSKMVYSYYSGIKMNPNKYFQLALDTYSKRNKNTYKASYKIQDLCGFARLTMTPIDADAIFELACYYDLDITDEIIGKSMQVLERQECSNPKTFDFADMIYLPATRPELINTKYKNVFVDEIQDSNKSQLQFIDNILEDGGRTVFIGDPNQTIYSFIGSNQDVFDSLSLRPNTSVLPLSVTYRCPKRSVEEANKIFPNSIKAHPNAIDGELRWGTEDEVNEGDMVLCRNNAPLLFTYFNLIERDIKAHIIGKDIEKDLISIVEDCEAKTVDTFNSNLDKKLELISERLKEKNVSRPEKHEKYINFLEKIDLIHIILEKTGFNIQGLIPKIKEIFDDKIIGARLMTIHKSKGLENDRVFFIKIHKGKQLMPSQFATQDWEIEQERRLEFVAVTRNKKSLIYLAT